MRSLRGLLGVIISLVVFSILVGEHLAPTNEEVVLSSPDVQAHSGCRPHHSFSSRAEMKVKGLTHSCRRGFALRCSCRQVELALRLLLLLLRFWFLWCVLFCYRVNLPTLEFRITPLRGTYSSNTRESCQHRNSSTTTLPQSLSS